MGCSKIEEKAQAEITRLGVRFTVGTGRPTHVVTSPERVAGNGIEKLFEKASR